MQTIKLGLQKSLELGNLSACRDIGNSKDYVRAMHLILQQEKPQDLVVATGNTWSVGDIVRYVYRQLDIDVPVEVNGQHFRPQELQYLKGDSSKIRSLG